MSLFIVRVFEFSKYIIVLSFITKIGLIHDRQEIGHLLDFYYISESAVHKISQQVDPSTS